MQKYFKLIDKEWIEFKKDSFELKAKINLIQKGLEIRKYL